jgi:OCT family organic cation transporter-like MFS transporter 4/5
MTKKSMCCYLTYFYITVFYGLIYSSTSLSSDVYLNFILNGLVEIPIVVICIFTMDHVGRKPLLVINMVLLTGVCCIPAGFASTSVKTVLVLVGRLIHSIRIAFSRPLHFNPCHTANGNY